MPAPKPRKRLRPRGFFGRWKWVLILIIVLLLIPAMQVAVVRFINPPLTLPMLIEKVGAMFSSSAEASAPLPLDRSAADSEDVSGAPLDFGRSAVLSARGL